VVVIDSSNVLQLRTSLSVASVAENTYNVEDRILVKILYKFKGYRAKKNSKFPDKGWTVNGLNYLLKKLRNISTIARQPGSGRRQSVRIVENVDTVDDLVLSHKVH